MPEARVRARRITAAGGPAAAAALAAVLLAACGSSSNATTGSTGPAAARAGGGNAAGGFGAGGQAPPGAFGLVAAMSPGSLEVQNQSTGQTTVTYTSGTSFTRTVSVPESAVTVGDCVTAVAAASSSPPSSSPSSPPSSPPSSSASPQTVTATTVTISRPVSGTCSRGFPGRNRPAGGGSGRSGRFGGFVRGTVTSVSATTIGVQALDRQNGSTVRDTVAVTAATKFTQTQPATAAALKVGVCVTATGTTASNGAVSARRIGISPAVNGACSSGFGGRGGFGGPGRFGAPGGSGTTGNA